MSVYISGIEMPTCCGECRFLDEYGDYPNCIITDEQRGYDFRVREKRMPHCPLFPVHDHGRLVDADVLGIFYQEQEELALQDFEEADDPYCGGVADGFHYAAKQLSCVPTIIPEDKEVDA